MEYRINYRKASRFKRLTGWLSSKVEKVKVLFNNQLSKISNKINMYKQTLFNTINFNRLGLLSSRILLLFIVLLPILLALFLIIYSIGWTIVGIAHLCNHDWLTSIIDFVPFGFKLTGDRMLGTILINLSLVFISCKCLYQIICSGLQNLNADLNSAKVYLIDAIVPIITSIIFTIIVFIPYCFIKVAILYEWIFKIVLVYIILKIIYYAIIQNEPEFDEITILIPRK